MLLLCIRSDIFHRNQNPTLAIMSSVSSPSLDSEIRSLKKKSDELYKAYQNANEPHKTKLLDAYTANVRRLSTLLVEKNSVPGENLFPWCVKSFDLDYHSFCKIDWSEALLNKPQGK